MFKTFKCMFSSSDEKALSLEEFNRKYKEHNDFIRKSIYWMTRSEDIDDLVQETFLRAWKNRLNFQKKSSYKTWLYKIAMNTCYDYKRKAGKVIELEEQLNLKDDHLLLKDLISKGLERLKRNDREVFILFYKLGHTKEEISKLTGLKLGTIKSKIHYSKKEFVLFLQENGVHNE